MRRLLLLIPLIVFACGTKPTTIEPIEKSFEAPGSKNELYVRANSWFSEAFNSPRMVIDFRDKEEGIITGKYQMAPKWAYNGFAIYQNGGYNANIQIQLKDSATKITVKPEQFVATGKFNKKKAILNIRKLINSYIDYMSEEQLTAF
ncbi:DUF4468 domain-containing protein [Salegentibacter salarius]|uniref:DUF4468 domain-containing protein n=1 Tax=Salegentibacter salarius TaxID=435906 RepID=A0A2N0TUW8_9FLAO|nr:DUF4468 domain-containing protein [Salegentibacter salarius]OEY72221.1 hypothetical protein BHS39_02970 [Salegentibacter salarius]PKD18543.1 hypothetical protein APR40_02970 [Salegentibacter salarius]SLJ88172.1 protein of unknown function [Salegentibacter salarius]